MAVVVKYVTKIRNNWKKSIFAAVVLSYGGSWAKEKYDTNELMREYCTLAANYGRVPILPNNNPRRITVILNPAANKRNALEEFENYCAPILTLAGLSVDVIHTTSEGHAKEIVSNELTGGSTDALVIAGGDGTVSEVVTGLLRRVGAERAQDLPIGILPLGRTNTLATLLFPGGEKLAHIKSMADASMAIIQAITTPVDVMKIEVLEAEDSESKPIYAISSIEWGAYRDAEMRSDKYWYWGSLRRYMTYVFNGYKSNLSWNCDAALTYSAPCQGCSNCYIKPDVQIQKKWYHKFLSQKSSPKNSNVQNANCAIVNEKVFSTADFKLISSNLISNELNDQPKLQLQLGPDNVKYIDFVTQGWRGLNGGERVVRETIEARQLEIKPLEKEVPSDKNDKEEEQWFSIDKEAFEVRPVRVTILPKILKIFCKDSANLNVS